MICVAAAQNALYGSTLSPPRLQQVREAFQEYHDATTQEQDALFHLFLPEICKQRKLDSTSPAEVQTLWKDLRTSPLLFKKGEKAIQL